MVNRNTEFVNALPKDRPAKGAIAIGILLQNGRTDEEKTVDLLVEDDSFATVLRAIRQHIPGNWCFVESWVIDQEQTESNDSVPMCPESPVSTTANDTDVIRWVKQHTIFAMDKAIA